MDIINIITDALIYPTKNIETLAIYLVLSIILGLTIGISGIGTLITATVEEINFGLLLVGIIIALVLTFLINGYALDIVKYGIKRSSQAPALDIPRQTINGFKLLIVQIVYFIIPVLISLFILLILNKWITLFIATILFVIFALAETMAECKLAQTDDLYQAINIGDSIKDISRVGPVKLVLTLIVIAIIGFIIESIIMGITGAIFSQTISSIISSIVGMYILFFGNRAIGLLYSYS